VGQLLQFTVLATDQDGDTLNYSASNLPSGASFNVGTRTFSWTPNYSQAGNYPNVHFEVSDGKASVYEDITIFVKSTSNSPPVLNPIGNKSINVGQILQFTISATDPDGNQLTYSASDLPFRASFNATTRTFSWTPHNGQVGTYPNVHFEVSDSSFTASENITITVAVPLSLPLRVEAGGKAYADRLGNSWQEDQAYATGSWGFYGENNTADRGIGRTINGTKDARIYQTERYGLSGYRFDLGNGTYRVILHFAETYLTGPGKRVFDVSIEGQLVLHNLDVFSEAGYSAALVKEFTIVVQDGQLNIVFSPFIELPEINGIEILNAAGANNPPVFNLIGNKSVNIGQLLQFTVLATDQDGDTLTYSASNLPQGTTFDPTSRTFSWTTDSGQAGTYSDVHFEVSDGKSSVYENITITVKDATSPEIQNVKVSEIGRNSAVISWTTNKPSTSQVQYWLSLSKVSPLYEKLVTTHEVRLFGLTPGKTYNLRTMSQDEAGNLAMSGWFKFTTRQSLTAFTVSGLNITPTEPKAGEAVTISVLVTNDGQSEGSYEVVLRIDNATESTKTVELAAGTTEMVTFTTTRDTAGMFMVDVNGINVSLLVKDLSGEKPEISNWVKQEDIKVVDWATLWIIIAATALAVAAAVGAALYWRHDLLRGYTRER
jgi:phage-related protein